MNKNELVRWIFIQQKKGRLTMSPGVAIKLAQEIG